MHCKGALGSPCSAILLDSNDKTLTHSIYGTNKDQNVLYRSITGLTSMMPLRVLKWHVKLNHEHKITIETRQFSYRKLPWVMQPSQMLTKKIRRVAKHKRKRGQVKKLTKVVKGRQGGCLSDRTKT